MGGKRERIALDIDQKETERKSYTLKLADLNRGEVTSRMVKGYGFGIRLKFLDGDELLGDYMIIPTGVFEDMLDE